MGAISKNMNGISFENEELLKDFKCDDCNLFLSDEDIKEENYSFWFSDYANKISKRDDGGYSVKFWLRGAKHREGKCPESERCQECYKYFRTSEVKEHNEQYYCKGCLKNNNYGK